MMFYVAHFFFCDFVCEDVCCAVDLQSIAVDDLSLQRLCQVNAEL